MAEEQYAGNEKILESSDLPEQPFPEAWNPLCFQDLVPASSFEDAIRDDVRDLTDHIIITGSSAFLSYELRRNSIVVDYATHTNP